LKVKAYEIQNGQINKAIAAGPAADRQGQAAAPKPGESFSEIFEKLSRREIRFSKHADTRLNARDIKLTGEQLSRVSSGVARAGAKGVIDGLVLVDGVALVVNVPSGTVVTAMDGKEANIFTNIDGAVIV
jgi:flagellar operon protein